MADTPANHIWYDANGVAVMPKDKKSMGGDEPCLFREVGRPAPLSEVEWGNLNERHLALERQDKGRLVDVNLQAGMTLKEAIEAAEKAKAPKPTADAPKAEEG